VHQGSALTMTIDDECNVVRTRVRAVCCSDRLPGMSESSF
jgi:hypothetical protein